MSNWMGEPDVIAVGDEFVLNLFPDVSYVATIDRVSTDVNDTLSIRGRLQGYEGGYVIISCSDQEGVYASIEVPEEDKEYVVLKAEDESYYVADVDLEDMSVRPDAPPLAPPSSSREEQTQTASSEGYMVASTLGPDDPATITVMIVYSPAAKDLVGSSGMNNRIAQAMEHAQLTLDNSDTGVTLQLVHSAQVDFTELGTGGLNLGALANPTDGCMDEVHQWRNAYHADLVQLFCVVNNVAGISYLLSNESGTPDWAFSLADIRYAGGLTPIHEMRHNMGCGHHKQDSQPGPGLFDYSAGWRFFWFWPSCTVMAYTDDYRRQIAYFSNPDVTYHGIQTGDPEDADNARTIREVKHVVAAYRTSGGGGCPFLQVWDGSEYVDEGLLDIHNAEATDVIYEHAVATVPEPISGRYAFRLTEHPMTISDIDQVQLRAILEDGTMQELPLRKAWHSEDSNVRNLLLYSDDLRVEELGADHNGGTSQSIDLEFAAIGPNTKAVAFIFTIEGYNPFYKI